MYVSYSFIQLKIFSNPEFIVRISWYVENWCVPALLFQKLTMISLPEKQVCYLSKLSDNLPGPSKLIKAFKKVNKLKNV